jgi:sigma-B regulation protein RsbU (phosphoserine phosphatase)
VGGDVFNIHRLDPDHVGIYVLDVAGHGVAAAMVAVSVAQRMNPQSGSLLKERLDTPPFYRVREPEGVLAGLDADFPIERFGRFFTMSYVLLNLRTGRLRHASAGHPQPIVQRRTGELVFLDASGPIVGLGGVIPFRGGEVSLQPGDRLFVYTDGIADAGVTHGERFGVNRLERVLGRCAERPIQSACDDVLRAVVEFAGGTRSDDVTFVGMEFRGSERRTARGAAA